MQNPKHEKLVDKIFKELQSRGFYDYVRKEFYVFDKNQRLRYSADIAGFKFIKELEMYEVNAFEIKTGRYKNDHKKSKSQSYQWFKNINSDNYPTLFSNNFIVAHSRKGMHRLNDYILSGKIWDQSL